LLFGERFDDALVLLAWDAALVNDVLEPVVELSVEIGE